jgi:hypothetical protein
MRVTRKIPLVLAAGALALATLLFSADLNLGSLTVAVRAAQPGADNELNRLLRARYAAASKVLDLEEQRLQQGVTTLGRVCEVARWTRDAVMELPSARDERVPALAKYVSLARRLEENVNHAVEQGAAAPVDADTARYLRLDAEIALLRLGADQNR